tara:strand:+ start:106 stop:729 length:624 start_codon:yes stop_codon:yes gene_type:complete
MSIDASKVIGQTQRNWDYESPVTEEEIQYLIDISLNAPVKENHNVYKLFVSTNIEFNQAIQELAYNYGQTGQRAQNTKERNAQVAAPLLMMYVVEDSADTNVGYGDTCFSIGIAAGATALASAEIGYQTGFCSCIHLPGLVEHMKNKFPGNFLEKFWTSSKIEEVLCLGVGKKNPNINNRSQIVKDGKPKFLTRIKNKTKPNVLIYK